MPLDKGQLEDAQGEVLDVRSQVAASLLDDLDNAETCETEADFRTNLDSAIEHAKLIVATLTTIKRGLR